MASGLQWVQDEISSFGGDPGNVTVMGQSSGAINVATLLGSPRAERLIHKVCERVNARFQYEHVEPS